MISIRNDQEFEAALEEALDLFDHPHAREAEGETRLGELLAAIGDYRPQVEAANDDAASGQLATLTERLDRLSAQRRRDHPDVPANGIDTGGFVFPG